LGRDKAVESIGGSTLLQRVVDTVGQLSDETLLITAPDPGERAVPARPGLRWLVDLYPGKGSLGGIYTGLHYATNPYGLVVACDMPFLNPDLLGYLLELAPDYDVVMPFPKDQQEPLHAVYSKACLGPIRTLLEQGKLQIITLLPLVRVRRVTRAEIERFDPEHLSFFNINTQADLDWARSRALSSATKERP